LQGWRGAQQFRSHPSTLPQLAHSCSGLPNPGGIAPLPRGG
jgi:hypothetical protein